MKDSIPSDLIYEIVSRLPGKSIGRCRCVSKLWGSILRRQDFIDSFLSRSSSARQDFTDLLLIRSSPRSRLLIGASQEGCEWSFYSTPLPSNPYEKWSNVVTANFHMKSSKDISPYECSYASGLIYLHEMCFREDECDVKLVICNPLTGQYVILPELRDGSYGYLGFDPIDYEFKVLVTDRRGFIATDCHILTLGSGELRWRKIQCPFTHLPFRKRICINGVLYYLAEHYGGRRINVIVCFDVRSEKFKFIEAECHYDQLINYKGELCGIRLEYDWDNACGGFLSKLRMWVLKDVKKQKWSQYVYSLPAESEVVKVGSNLSVSGMTATGDIVLTMRCQLASKPFYVCYLNPERKTLRIVEIQGLARANPDGLVYVNAFVDYVEDLSVNNALQFKSISSQQGQNPKPQQCRHTSRDLSKSTQSVKNKYELLTNLCEEDLSVNDAIHLGDKTGTSSRTGTNN